MQILSSATTGASDAAVTNARTRSVSLGFVAKKASTRRTHSQSWHTEPPVLVPGNPHGQVDQRPDAMGVQHRDSASR